VLQCSHNGNTCLNANLLKPNIQYFKVCSETKDVDVLDSVKPHDFI